MNTLLLDQTRWDLCLDASGNIAMAAEPYAIAQDAASAMRLFLAELYYNTARGVPYLSQILGRFPPASIVKERMVRAALTVPGVTGALCNLTSLRNRTLSGQVLVTTATGTLTVGFISNPSGITTSVGAQ